MTQNDHGGPTNRLALETSPYLLQHQFNPVDWWAWGPDAFAAAKAANKPVLLSVGYAACHWCHVMAHESFEDADTAALMNRLFINIKVDREERPDVDQIYMAALHRLGEHGGWPLTMFLTPDAEPFWGGTYFPPEPRYGRPSFRQVLESIAKTYETDGEKVRYNTDLLKRLLTDEPDTDVRLDLREEKLRYLVERFQTVMDGELGGLRGAPKFPQASFFGFLWRGGIRYADKGAQAAIRHTLNRICQGGIYDHIGGGFARYSVDEFWLVPHFEKMLYDNAQLLGLLAEVWRETQEPLFAARARETVGWLLREMRGADGGFAASLDADSEGEEGKFYVWTRAEVMAVLGGRDGAAFCAAYDITDEGNFEGHAIPNLLGFEAPFDGAADVRFAAMRARLLEARAARVRPGLDDKILADWNGLMIRALAHAGFVFGETEWITEARAAFAFVQDRLGQNGRLMHSYRAGRLTAPASSADYANMISAALTLYQVTSETAYRDQAIAWQADLDRHFWAEAGGYYTSADDTTDLIVRMRVANDDATPNANATTVGNLVALAMITGDTAYETRARAVLDGFAADIGRNPVAHAGLLASAIDLLAPCHVVVAGEGADGLVRGLSQLSLPGAVIERLAPGVALPPASPAATALAGMPAGSTFGLVCVGTTCHPPATTEQALKAAAQQARALALAVS